MLKTSQTLIAIVLLIVLTGCGGSSVDLPEEVLTADAYALQWIDFKAMPPDEGVDLLATLAEDMPDDQPKARLWLSAEADSIDGTYRERWGQLTDAGGVGLLTVYYRVEKKVGEGENAPVRTYRETHTFLKAKKGADAGELAEALESMNAQGLVGVKVRFVEVGEKSGWYWITQQDAPEGALAMPDDADEDTFKQFKKLLADAGDAPIVSAWRMTGPVTEAIDEHLKLRKDELTQEEKDDLANAKATESVVMAVTPGNRASVSLTIRYTESDQATAFVDEHNADLIEMRRGLKRSFIKPEIDNPPHPSVIDRLVGNLELAASGKSVSLTLETSDIEDLLNLYASNRGGSDPTSPGQMIRLNPNLGIDWNVPGVRSCYDQLGLGRDKQPSSRME